MMKGEYRDDDDPLPPPTTSTPQITSSTPQHFPTFHPYPRPTFLSPPHFLSPHPSFHPQNPQTTLPPPQQPPSSKKPRHTPTSSDDATAVATIELPRRPRGRPPGSKNKPKPPTLTVTHQPDPNMSPYILELSSGSDLTSSLTRFTRRRGHSLCLLTATGAVSNLTLNSSRGTVSFHGRYELLSLSGVIMISAIHSGLWNGNEITVSLAGPQGQVVGGKVAGKLVCSGTVYVVATSFDNPTYCRLPLDDDDDDDRGGPQDGGGAHVGLYSSTTEVMWGNTTTTTRPPEANY